MLALLDDDAMVLEDTVDVMVVVDVDDGMALLVVDCMALVVERAGVIVSVVEVFPAGTTTPR